MLIFVDASISAPPRVAIPKPTTAIVLALNLLVLANNTALSRAKATEVINPEDTKLNAKAAVALDAGNDDTARYRRAHRNALENIPLFLITGLLLPLIGTPFLAAAILRDRRPDPSRGAGLRRLRDLLLVYPEPMSETEELGAWVSDDVIETLELARDSIDARAIAGRVDQIRTRALWNLRARSRERMVEQLHARGLPAGDSDALWIGWAGPICADARPTLLMRDLARLERLLDDPMQAARVIIAGPIQGAEGPALAATLTEIATSPGLESRVLFTADGGEELGRLLAQGVDLWLTTAIHGSELGARASARAAANGAINVASETAWWAELDQPEAGWTIGGPRAFDDQDAQDEHDARALYELLERSVIPSFYDWDSEGVPLAWVERIRASMRAIPMALEPRVTRVAGAH